MRIYAYAVLALREGNAWRQEDYDAFFGEAENARFLVVEGGGYEFEVVLKSGETEVEGGSESLPPGLMRRTTTGMEEGRRSAHAANSEHSGPGDPARISLDDCTNFFWPHLPVHSVHFCESESLWASQELAGALV